MMDILILSNGPGELTTWVRPVVQAIRKALQPDHSRVRISVVLSPCPHASGSEARIARSFPEVNRVQGPEHFWAFLLRGQTADDWEWSDRGVVVFLGGDQFFTLVLGKRLGYHTVVYAEWEARWQPWIDHFGVMNAGILQKVNPNLRSKFTVVGDLMAESGRYGRKREAVTEEWIGILPGSKRSKLIPGLPFGLAIAQWIHRIRPQTRFAIPVAPTVDLPTLAQYGNPQFNQAIQHWPTGTAELVISGEGLPRLKTPSGLEIELWTEYPAYHQLIECQLCLTTAGANTAELGSLGIPMMVLLPTQQLDVMRSWDGIPGLLTRLPGVGSGIATVLNQAVLFSKRGQFFAWPNLWAQEMIVPERVGRLQVEEIGQEVIEYLDAPERLEQMSDRLSQVRGEPGAAPKLAQLILATLRELAQW